MLSPRQILLVALVVGAAVTTGRTATAQVVVPPRVLERSDPSFPAAARTAGVEGDVRFRAAIDATGRVQHVDIDSVPQADLGFEDAVTSAVSQWRFAPASLRGAPAPSEYSGTLHFALTLPGQAILSASSQDAWLAVRAMVRQLKIPVEKADDHTQLLISGPVKYLALTLPDAATLGLPLGFTPNRVTLHVYVTPGMQPARVAVGSVMDLLPVSSSDRRGLTAYGHDAIARWFLGELARRMGVRMEPLAASAERRALQSRALMPPGLSDPCSTTPAALVSLAGAPQGRTVTPPEALFEVKPIYPADQLDARKMAKIVFHGEITEHGTLVNPVMTEPADAPRSFVSSAQLAAGLWRFTPPQGQGCPMRTNATFQLSYTLK